MSHAQGHDDKKESAASFDARKASANAAKPATDGAIKIGSTEIWNGEVHQWDGQKWFRTGVMAGGTPKESSRFGDTINIGGRVMQWNPSTSTYDIDLGSSSGPAAPPASPAPRYPTGGVDSGQTYVVDPYTGQITFGQRVPGTFTDEQKRENDLTDLYGQRTYTTGERLGGERFTAGENAAGRTFTSGENALNRALEAGQFSATLAAKQKSDQFAADESYQNRIRQYAQDKLSAAQAFASQVGAVDPAALEAFYAAGGGNIANALAGGANAVSDNAVLPAARSLRATREMLAPTRYTGFDSPYAAPAAPTMAAGGQPNMQPKPTTPPPVTAPITQVAPSIDGGSWSPGTSGQSWTDRAGTPDWAKGPTDTPRYAFGTQGEPATGTFITGDSTDPGNPFAGGAKPEKITVNDPPGPNNAQAEVEPLAPPVPPQMGNKPKLAELFSVIGALLSEEQMGGMPMDAGMDAPRYAYGTDGYETITPTAEDQPYVDEVRNIRNNVQFPNLNPYDTKFRFNPYSLQDRFYAGRRTKFGVPVADQQQEQQRYQLQGVNRGAYSLGT